MCGETINGRGELPPAQTPHLAPNRMRRESGPRTFSTRNVCLVNDVSTVCRINI